VELLVQLPHPLLQLLWRHVAELAARAAVDVPRRVVVRDVTLSAQPAPFVSTPWASHVVTAVDLHDGNSTFGAGLHSLARRPMMKLVLQGAHARLSRVPRSVAAVAQKLTALRTAQPGPPQTAPHMAFAVRGGAPSDSWVPAEFQPSLKADKALILFLIQRLAQELRLEFVRAPVGHAN